MTQPVRRRIAWHWIAALVLIAASLTRYWRAENTRGYVSDEGIYTYVGWAWGQGDWPYRDAWDHKGPVTYVVTLARTSLFGTDPRFLQVQEVSLGIAMAVAASGIAALLWGSIPAATVAAAGILFWTARPPWFGHMSTVGSIIGLLTMAALYLAVKAVTAQRRMQALLLISAGIAGGLSFCTKPNAMTAIAGVGLVVLVFRLRSGPAEVARGVLWALIGFVLPAAAFAVVFWRAGALPHLLDVVFGFNALRGPLVIAGFGLQDIARKSLRLLWQISLLPLSFTVLGAGMILLLQRLRHRNLLGIEARGTDLIAPLALGMEGVILVSNGAFGHSIYTVLPVLALGAGWLMSLAERSRLPARRLVIGAVALCALGPSLFLGVGRLSGGERSGISRAGVMAAWIDSNTTPGERVVSFVDPHLPGALAMAHHLSATRYMYPTGLYLPGYASDRRWSEVLASVSGPQPARIVLINDDSSSARDTGAIRINQLASRIDRPFLRSLLVDSTAFPARERLKELLVARYRIAGCQGGMCMLRRLVETPPGP